MGDRMQTSSPVWTARSPLTERVLARLGRPRPAWIAAWSLVPLVEWLIFTTAVRLSVPSFEEQQAADVLFTQAVLVYVVALLLVGTQVVTAKARVVAEGVESLVDLPVTPPLFHRIGSTVGPLGLTVIAVIVVSVGGLLRYGPLPPLVAVPLLVVYLVPILTFFWVYVVILADIDRLGRQALRLDTFPQDRTLGLKEVGSLASAGLGLLLAAAVPLMLVGADEPVTLGISLVIVAIAVGVFVLSMWRLHGQMATARTRSINLTRRLYSEAFAPLRDDPSVAVLEHQSTALSAAQELDQRAHGLPTWPIDENTSRLMVVIVTGIVTGLVVRGLFAAIGA